MVNEDTNRPVTYGDLSEFRAAVKVDIIEFKTELKNDIQHLDEKFEQKFQQLDQKFDRMAIDHARLCGYVYGMEHRIAELVTKQHHEMMTVVGKFASDIERVDKAEVILRHRVGELDGLG